MSDWEEIRRLAADFQRAQSAGAAQKLSERNCIEIVMKLLELKMIDVIYTSDGKEYLTPAHLLKEVKDEIYVSGGRCGLVEIAAALNVDFSHVEQTAQHIAKLDRDIHLILGQLVSYRYLDDMAREVNEKLQHKGILSMPSLTKEYNLPADFLMEEISKRIGSIIEGFKDETDPKIIMTQSYIARNRAKVRGVLSAVTVPTPCSTIVSRFGFQEKLFFTLADELIRTRRIPGSISGGRNVSKATYIPHSYVRSQNSWIDNFYSSNGYLEFDSLSRMGISEPEQFLKKKFKDEKLIFLESCCLGPALIDQIETAVDEALGSGSWIDLVPLLPSVLSQEDELELVQQLLKDRRHAMVLGSSTLLSQKLADEVRGSLELGMEARAKQDVESGAVAQALVDTSRGAGVKEDDEKQDRKEERRKKAAGGKAGGGAQGRETKTKSTKKKGGPKKKDEDWDDSEDEARGIRADKEGKAGKRKELEYKSLSELSDEISTLTVFADCPEEIFSDLAAHLHDGLNRRYRELAASVYQATLAASLHNKRRTHSDLQEKMNNLYTSLRLHEKALHEFKNEDHKTNLAKYLLKTAGTEVITEMFLYLAEENMIKMEDCKELSLDNRVKIIKELPSEVAEPAMKLHKSLGGNSAEEFLHLLEEECMRVCDVMLKKPDKKKDRQILFSHRHELNEQLSNCSDPALCLHLAALIIFQHATGCMLQASGKFVPSILAFLKDHLTDEQTGVLVNHQQLVVNHLKDKEGDAPEELVASMTAVKSLVANLKKSNDDK